MTLRMWLAAAALLPLAALACWRTAAGTSGWTEAERTTLASLHIARLGTPPAAPSNAVEARPEAAAVGKRLFFETRLSANGQVACASYHAPERGFQDGRPLGQGLVTGSRRTMPLAAAAHGRWFFWDGRKDSLWAQALGPLSPLAGLPESASLLGAAAEREAWARLPATQQDAIDRAFANLGKAIAAYERRLVPGENRLDRYIAGDAAALSASEVRGLRLFIGKAQCVSCHAGPLLTDQHFHNTGIAPRNPLRPDRGRAPAVARVQADPFNCLGPYSDAPPGGCPELSFIATDDPRMDGTFKTPGLRNAAERAPYMHAGQIATLEAVVAHCTAAPDAAVDRGELARAGQRRAERRPIALNDAEAADLVALLRALSGPVCDSGNPC